MLPRCRIVGEGSQTEWTYWLGGDIQNKTLDIGQKTYLRAP